MSLLQHDSKRGKYDQVWRTVWLLGLTRANSRPNSHNICIVYIYIYTINIIYGFLSNKIQWYMHENAKGTRNGITSANRFGGAISWMLNRSTIYIYIDTKREMTKDVSMLVHLTYSVVDAFQAHRLFPFALSPSPLTPSPFPKQRESDR